MNQRQKQVINFGWANGWSSEPEEITEAKGKGFQVKETSYDNGRHVTSYKIETDDAIYTWRVDTSG